jgi:hypothetical protein
MSSSPIDDFLKRFDQLSAEQREQLLDELEQRQIVPTNGSASVRTLFEAFQERGLIGSIKGAPGEWSSNPDYLEGFGKLSDAQ